MRALLLILDTAGNARAFTLVRREACSSHIDCPNFPVDYSQLQGCSNSPCSVCQLGACIPVDRYKLLRAFMSLDQDGDFVIERTQPNVVDASGNPGSNGAVVVNNGEVVEATSGNPGSNGAVVANNGAVAEATSGNPGNNGAVVANNGAVAEATSGNPGNNGVVVEATSGNPGNNGVVVEATSGNPGNNNGVVVANNGAVIESTIGNPGSNEITVVENNGAVVQQPATRPLLKGYATYHRYSEESPLTTVSCSDGENGLITRWGYSNVGPMWPYVSAFSNLAWNSPVCGTCMELLYNRKSIYVTVIDQCGPVDSYDGHFDIAPPAYEELFGASGVTDGSRSFEYREVPPGKCRGNLNSPLSEPS